MTITMEIVSAPRTAGYPFEEVRVGLTRLTIRKTTATDADGWRHYAYRVRLTNTENGQSMEEPYRMGIANTKPPTAADVLSALLSDASAYENADGLDDFASEFGYSESVSKAVATYAAVEEVAKNLRRVLGPLYEDAIRPPDDHEEAAKRLTQ